MYCIEGSSVEQYWTSLSKLSVDGEAVEAGVSRALRGKRGAAAAAADGRRASSRPSLPRFPRPSCPLAMAEDIVSFPKRLVLNQDLDK